VNAALGQAAPVRSIPAIPPFVVGTPQTHGSSTTDATIKAHEHPRQATPLLKQNAHPRINGMSIYRLDKPISVFIVAAHEQLCAGPGHSPDLIYAERMHRSHFGSRYHLGCCGNASLFSPRFESPNMHTVTLKTITQKLTAP
jgi:hypothetical protein